MTTKPKSSMQIDYDGDIDCAGTMRIVRLPDPSSAGDSVNKRYADTKVPNSLTLTLAGTTNQLSVSPTGAIGLSADRTWTFDVGAFVKATQRKISITWDAATKTYNRADMIFNVQDFDAAAAAERTSFVWWIAAVDPYAAVSTTNLVGTTMTAMSAGGLVEPALSGTSFIAYSQRMFEGITNTSGQLKIKLSNANTTNLTNFYVCVELAGRFYLSAGVGLFATS